MAAPEVQVIIQGSNKNTTRHLYGHVIRNLPINLSLSDVKEVPVPYDSRGAMTYTFAVLFVYSISIFLLIATLSRRKTSSMKIETEVNTYMKGLEFVYRQGKMDQVLYARFKIPGNFVGMRSDTRMARYMKRKYGITSVLKNCVDKSHTVSFQDFDFRDFGGSPSIPEEEEEEDDNFNAYRGRVRRQAMLSVETSSDESDDEVQLLPAITHHQETIEHSDEELTEDRPITRRDTMIEMRDSSLTDDE